MESLETLITQIWDAYVYKIAIDGLYILCFRQYFCKISKNVEFDVFTDQFLDDF